MTALFDDAPGIWIDGSPAQTEPVTRKSGSGGTNQIIRALSDHAEHTATSHHHF
jgi:hypothetical protein